MKRQRSEPRPHVAQYFRNYRNREIRGSTKDALVSIRGPFDLVSPTTSPRQEKDEHIDEVEDYEFAAPATTTIDPTIQMKRASVSLPSISISSPLSSPVLSSTSTGATTSPLSASPTSLTSASSASSASSYYFGKEGKQLFKTHMLHFDQMHSKTLATHLNNNDAWTPRSLYLRDTMATRHTPVIETLPIRKDSKSGVFNLSLKGLTGARLGSLSRVLPNVPNLIHFDISNNRAQLQDGSSTQYGQLFAKPSTGLSKTFIALGERTDLLSINVASNIVPMDALATLGYHIAQKQTYPALQKLCFHKCSLTDEHITMEIAQQLATSATLSDLDLSDNHFRKRYGALFNLASVPNKIKKRQAWSTLTALNISNNRFDKEDMVQLLASFGEPNGCFAKVPTLNISLVQIGRCPMVVKALVKTLSFDACAIQSLHMRSASLGLISEHTWLDFSKSLGMNESIEWLDLSHNQIPAEKTMVLGDQLLTNHTLLDFYYRHGNCGRVDNMGFLLPSRFMTTSALEDAAHGRYEKPNEDSSRRRHFEQVGGGDANRDYPWKTGKWTEICFTWTPGLSGSGTDKEVYLRLGADRWWPCPMQWNEVNGSFQAWRSLPPGIYKYLFQVGGTEENKDSAGLLSFEFADDQNTEPLLDPSISCFGEWTPNQLMVNVITIGPSAHPSFQNAPPRPLFASRRRIFDEEDFQDRSSPSFVVEDESKIKKKKKHSAGLIASVFAPRRASSGSHDEQYYDLPSRYSKAAMADMERMVRGETLKDIVPFTEVESIETFLKQNYSTICHIHRWFGSYGIGSLYAINMGVFRMFLGNVQLIADQSGRNNNNQNGATPGTGAPPTNYTGWPLTENDVVMIFKKAETSQYARKAGDKSNSVGKALDRFEFTEALVRVALRMQRNIANWWPIESGGIGASDDNVQVSPPPETLLGVLKHLFRNHLEKYSDRSSGNEFRKKFLYISGVDGMLRKRMHLLKSVFHHYSAMFSHGSGRNTMSFKEWETLLKGALKWRAPPEEKEAPVSAFQKLLNDAKAAKAAEVATQKEEEEEEEEKDQEQEQEKEKLEEANQPDEPGKTLVGDEEPVPESDPFDGTGNFSLGLGMDGDFGEMNEGDYEDEENTGETDDGVPLVDEWDENDEELQRAIRLVQVRMRFVLARIRVRKVKDAKAERLLAMKAASQPLQASDGQGGIPSGEFIRRQSMRADVLELSETIRREQEVEMGNQKSDTDVLIGGLNDLDIRQAFSFSQMLFIDELVAKKNCLTFCDFLEGLVRLSHTISNTMNKKSKSESPEVSGAQTTAWYDNDGMLQSKTKTHWGKYEGIGEEDEEIKIKKEIEHLSRFELVLDKITTAERTKTVQK